jgi:hypothetical protein
LVFWKNVIYNFPDRLNNKLIGAQYSSSAENSNNLRLRGKLLNLSIAMETGAARHQWQETKLQDRRLL